MPTNANSKGADLQLIAASGPTSANIGDLINVSWTTYNDSLVAANDHWLDAVYLSSDAVLDENDTGASFYSAGPLYAERSYSLDAFFSVPYISNAGRYYLIFSADSFGEQAETDESNNDLALPINLDLNGPDLHLLSASAPTSASLGSPITVSWTAKNQGVAAASNNWWDAIYLSIDAILDENDVYANQYANDAALAADSSYSRSLTFSIPSISTAGQYYILFSTDDYGQQGETDESNNHLAVPINLDLNGPDLQLLSASAPASASAGSPITVSWTVKNQGAATASNDWSDVIYLSKDDVYNDSDTYVAGFSAADQSPLAAGGSYTQTKTIWATGIDTAAQYYLIFRTNSYSYSGQAEISKANNDLAIPINLDLNVPDLQLLSASAPASASFGSPITVSWTVKNQGAATASNDWSDDVYLSKDSRYDYSDTFLTRSNAADQSPLAAGSSYTQTKAISAPSIDTAGQYYLIFRTNSYSNPWQPEQAEISKANNDLAIPISLDLKVPDPMVTLAVSPSAVAEDGNSNIIYTFSRTGDTSNGLSVHYALGGTATQGIDYTGIAATWTPIRSVSFAAGTASATIMVDPTVDSEIEPDESIKLSLYPGYGYSIGTTAWVVGTILNAAPSTTIDLFGNTRLLNRGDGMAFVEFGPGPGPIPGMRKEISSPWNSPVGNEFSEWQMLAAETIAGNNQILLRNNTYNFLHTWTLDANWNWQSSNGADAFNSPGAWWLESSFQVDANRDRIIGPPFLTPTPMSLP